MRTPRATSIIRMALDGRRKITMADRFKNAAPSFQYLTFFFRLYGPSKSLTTTTMSSEDEFSQPTTPPMSNGNDIASVGLSNPQLSQGRRRMLDLVNRLHSTGLVGCFFIACFFFLLIDQCRVQVDIDIPQIAVIGQQSAGKSSLIEAISGITLPRSAGTCTRYVFPICTVVYT